MFRLSLLRIGLAYRQGPNHGEPRNEHQISIANLVPNQVLFSRFLEMSVNHSNYALDLIPIPVFCAGYILVFVEEGEPRLLSKVWPLSAGLKLSPGLLLVLLRELGVAKFVLLVVGVD